MYHRSPSTRQHTHPNQDEMSFPGMPGQGLAGGAETAGMSAQEQNMVKNVERLAGSEIILLGDR